MKGRIIRLFIVTTLCALVTVSFGQVPNPLDNRAPSRTAPVPNNGTAIPRNQLPLFIIVGSDDNTNAQAVTWMANVLSNGTNRDGSRRYMSFYVNTSSGWASGNAVRNAVVAAYNQGHSIANHTHSHINCRTGGANGGRMTVQAIQSNMQSATDAMIAAGIPKAHQFGFRTPFLAYTDSTYIAMQRIGFMYDASINSSRNPGDANFPYTLNLPTTGRDDTSIGGYPGLWTIPITRVSIPAADRPALGNRQNIAGLDWNMWADAGMDSGQTVRALMNTVQMSLDGNRAPVSLGFHSQFYFTASGISENPLTLARRRGLFEEFVRQASQLDNVFFVSADMVIRWMQNPVPASQFRPENYHRNPPAVQRFTVTFNANGGSPTPAAQTLDANSVITQPTATAPARSGYTFGGWWTAQTGGSQWNFDTGRITANITLWARWTPITYTITYNLDGGTNDSRNPANFTVESANITLRAPTKAHNTFGGWFTNANFTGTAVTSIPTGSTGNRTFWARWNRDACTFGSWSSWTTTREPTCTEAGSRERTRSCTISGCSNIETQAGTLSARGHDWGEPITIQATCDASGNITQYCLRDACGESEVLEILPQLTEDECATSIKTVKSDKRHGIRFAVNPVNDKAEITVILPDASTGSATEVSVVIYDMTGNVVFASTASTGSATGAVWDLRNSAGRFVANGTYLVVAEVKALDGRVYRYSSLLGVKR